MFLNSGFDEIVTTSLVGDNLYKRIYGQSLIKETALIVMNPQSERC